MGEERRDDGWRYGQRDRSRVEGIHGNCALRQSAIQMRIEIVSKRPERSNKARHQRNAQWVPKRVEDGDQPYDVILDRLNLRWTPDFGRSTVRMRGPNLHCEDLN